MIEAPARPFPGPGRIRKDFAGLYAGNAIVAFLFACSGPVAIILAVGSRGGLSESDIASWIFGAFFLNTLISLVLTLAYRQPLIFLWSIPGAVLVGPALAHLSFAEVIGAFMATGVLMLALGVSGWWRRAMAIVPMPIVMAMVAGVFLRFGVDLVLAFRDAPWIAAPMTAAFIAFTLWNRFVPPLIAALVAGALAMAIFDLFKTPAGPLLAIASPNLYVPAFSWRAMVELVIPLAITVLVVQNGQGTAVLTANGHQPPINAITAACGAGSILTGLFGAVSTCLTGPVNAILSGSGDRERHYVAALVFCLLAAAFGLLAPFFTRLLFATPPAFIAALAGLAMLRVLQTAFAASFGGGFTLGALVCFLVTVADVPVFNIGAPFWGLVFGLATSKLLERK
ncbi:MAG TPA: benzoate/H(+) symporter BenE family transporter [Burkholderiales bacterium]|nr:benzoate/H(+) symporter BenE family transporter [Burkholderiales bacterium]